MKKADLSINIIIITIIALVVLIVLTFVFTGRLFLFNQKITDCSVIKEAQCRDSCNEEEGFIHDQTRVCFELNSRKVDPMKVCCVPLLRQSTTESQ